jgi:hypothetical protein
MTSECRHDRIKKNYPFGKKSGALMSCKDCGSPISRYDLMLKRTNKKRKSRR